MRSIMVLHIGAGMAGLFLVIPRILARLIDTKPTQIDHGNPLNHFLAKTVHVMLYLLLIIVPLVGWIIVNAKGMLIPMPLLGFEFPALVPASTELVNTTVLIHEILARAFYVIIGLHVIAALWHHFVKKDGVLCHITWITPPSQQPVIATSYKHIPKSKIKQYSQA